MAVQGEDLYLDVVSFVVAGSRFAMEMDKVLSLEPTGRGEDHCPRIETCLGLDAPAQPSLRTLRLKASGQAFAVGGAIDLQRMPARRIHPLPALVSTHMRIKAVRALAFDDDGPILIVDPARMTPERPSQDTIDTNSNNNPANNNPA